MTSLTLPILILGAGASSRMRGGDKLLEDVIGAPCLRVLAQRALDTGQPVFVTLPNHHHPRAAALDGLDVHIIDVPDADKGMSHSLQRGVAALPDSAKAVLILPGDMPDITTDDLNTMLDRFSDAPNAPILRATTQDGTAGHPVVFAQQLFAEFAQLEGDRGAASIIKTHADQVLHVPLPDDRARLDLDTPEDWANWRARD